MKTSTATATVEPARAAPPPAPAGLLGPARGFRWAASATHVDMSAPLPPPRPLTLPTEPQHVTLDLERTALLVIDMQNDFCAQGGWVDHLGVDYTPDRAPIAPLRRLLPPLRAAGVTVVWVNWGNRADLANMPPNQIHLYKPRGAGVGLGDPLPGSGAPVLQKDSWAAAVVDELAPAPDDLRVDKYRISGFWDTPLDSILRNLQIRTVLFAGVNTDQCVLCTLQDANFLGYGCVLVSDCCATTSPAYCTDATIFNVKKCFGFVTDSAAIVDALTSTTTAAAR
jgi:nicotinamidase-related amidase